MFNLLVFVKYVLMFGWCILMFKKFSLGVLWVMVISDLFILKLIFIIIGVLCLKVLVRFNGCFWYLMFLVG